MTNTVANRIVAMQMDLHQLDVLITELADVALFEETPTRAKDAAARAATALAAFRAAALVAPSEALRTLAAVARLLRELDQDMAGGLPALVRWLDALWPGSFKRMLRPQSFEWAAGRLVPNCHVGTHPMPSELPS